MIGRDCLSKWPKREEAYVGVREAFDAWWQDVLVLGIGELRHIDRLEFAPGLEVIVVEVALNV